MEKMLREIRNGIRKREHIKIKTGRNYVYGVKGIGSKAYIIKRIDFVRDELLEMKKELIKEN